MKEDLAISQSWADKAMGHSHLKIFECREKARRIDLFYSKLEEIVDLIDLSKENFNKLVESEFQDNNLTQEYAKKELEIEDMFEILRGTVFSYLLGMRKNISSESCTITSMDASNCQSSARCKTVYSSNDGTQLASTFRRRSRRQKKKQINKIKGKEFAKEPIFTSKISPVLSSPLSRQDNDEKKQDALEVKHKRNGYKDSKTGLSLKLKDLHEPNTQIFSSMYTSPTSRIHLDDRDLTNTMMKSKQRWELNSESINLIEDEACETKKFPKKRKQVRSMSPKSFKLSQQKSQAQKIEKAKAKARVRTRKDTPIQSVANFNGSDSSNYRLVRGSGKGALVDRRMSALDGMKTYFNHFQMKKQEMKLKALQNNNQELLTSRRCKKRQEKRSSVSQKNIIITKRK